jgi:hypothetical protein
MAASQSTIKALNSEAFHKEFTSIFCTMLLNYSRFPMVRYGSDIIESAIALINIEHTSNIYQNYQ